MRALIREKLNRIRSGIVGKEGMPAPASHQASSPKRQRKLSRKASEFGTHDIPIFAFPVKEIPRLEKIKGFVGINRITMPSALRE
jgi:hypothetical protein